MSVVPNYGCETSLHGGAAVFCFLLQWIIPSLLILLFCAYFKQVIIIFVEYIQMLIFVILVYMFDFL